jgi:transposase
MTSSVYLPSEIEPFTSCSLQQGVAELERLQRSRRSEKETDWRGVESLMALRGVQLVTAMSIVAELGDISRFESPPR